MIGSSILVLCWARSIGRPVDTEMIYLDCGMIVGNEPLQQFTSVARSEEIGVADHRRSETTPPCQVPDDRMRLLGRLAELMREMQTAIGQSDVRM